MLKLRNGRKLTEFVNGRAQVHISQWDVMRNRPDLFWSDRPSSSSYVAMQRKDGTFLVLSVNGMGEVRWEVDPTNEFYMGDRYAKDAIDYFFEVELEK